LLFVRLKSSFVVYVAESWGCTSGGIVSMRLSLQEVEHVAKLAQLALSEAEKGLFQEQLSSILEYAERLGKVDTDAIPPTATVLPLENVMRDDRIRPSLPQAEVLANAPSVEGDCFQVPVVLEGEG
jgi:aspartyl-tRNA(Asn)/glutamyl-tRNA(Gln) amidotransferase subunit C